MLPTETVYVEESGTGTPVVVLHGSVSSGRQWNSLREYIHGSFRVIAPDLPGYGKSRSVMTGGDMNTMLQALVPVLRRQNQPVHLVGHSFGGAIATRLALQFPELVCSLTVIEPTVFNYVWRDTAYNRIDLERVFDLVHRMESAIDAGDNWSAMGRFIDFWNGPGAFRRTSTRLATRLAPFAAQVVQDFATLNSDTSTWRDLTDIACPVFVMSGSRSPQEIRKVTDQYARSIPNSRHTVVAGAGHMVPLTDPHIVDVAVRKFLVHCGRQWQVNSQIHSKAA